VCLIDDVSMEQQRGRERRGDPKSHPNARRGSLQRTNTPSAYPFGLRSGFKTMPIFHERVSFRPGLSPLTRLAPPGGFNAYLNNASFVIRGNRFPAHENTCIDAPCRSALRDNSYLAVALQVDSTLNDET